MLSNIQKLKEIIENSKLVNEVTLTEGNYLEILTKSSFASGDGFALYLLEYEGNEFYLTDMAYILENFEGSENEEDLTSHLKNLNLFFDGTSIYAKVDQVNILNTINKYIQLLKILKL